MRGEREKKRGKEKRGERRSGEGYLVRAADEVEVVAAQELGHDVLSEGEADTAIVLAPAHDVLVGVGPQQVAEQARVCGGEGERACERLQDGIRFGLHLRGGKEAHLECP